MDKEIEKDYIFLCVGLPKGSRDTYTFDDIAEGILESSDVDEVVEIDSHNKDAMSKLQLHSIKEFSKKFTRI